MPSGRGRGGGASGADASLLARFDQLEQLVRGLHGARGGVSGGNDNGKGQTRASRAGSKGGGKGGGGGDTTRGTNSRSRPGDWTCRECGAFPCFAKAVVCFACRAPRSPAEAGAAAHHRGTTSGSSVAHTVSTSTYLGPVGANGARPLLGGRGHQQLDRRRAEADATCPTVRVPGASAAARAEQQRAARTTSAIGNAAAVQRGPGAASVGPADGTLPQPVSHAPPPVRTANRWSALDEGSEDDAEDDAGDCMQDVGMANDADEDGGGTAEAERDAEAMVPPEPTAAQLRHEWDRHSAAVRLLEKDSASFPPALVAEARRQRDMAESRWRAAKPQQPLHKRVRWAEAELRDAQGKEEVHRKELEEHLATTARRTRELEARLEVDVARTLRKKAALDDLRGREATTRSPVAEAAARMAMEGIASDVAPLMSAIAASLGDGDADKRSKIQDAIQSLSRVEDVLREATAAAEQGRPPAGALGAALGASHYDISDDAGSAATNDTSPHHPVSQSPAQPPRWTRAGPAGQWKKARTSTDAVEEARRILGGQIGLDAAHPASGKVADADGAAEHQVDAARSAAGASDADDPTRTNDLAESARRAEREAQRQFQDALRHQARQAEPQQRREEDEQRIRREQQQQLELQRHQAAMEQAAAQRAAEEARQREDLVSRMSPAELARAAEVHAQQQAVAAHAFGTLSASQVAGLVHQAHVENVVQEAAREGAQADHDYLMSLSPEDLAQWERDRQGDSGAVPW